MSNTTIGLLAYADDLALLGNNLDTVKQNCRKLINVAGKCGLKINDKKTEYVIIGRRSREYRQGEFMETDHHKFKRTSHFKYLGSIITQDSDLKMEMDTRILMGNRCYFGLGSMFSSKILSTKLKIQLYMTLIRPVVLYGSETWTLRKVEETRLAVFERKILRRIYGPCIDSETGEWRIRHNDELKNLFQKPDIISEINRRRLMWAGHAWRKEGSFIKAVIKENPTGKRPLGRPRLWDGLEGCNPQEEEDQRNNNIFMIYGAPPPPVHAINRGIGFEGLGTVFAGLMGSGNGTNTFGENVGAIGVTKIGSRRVIQYASALMLIQGVVNKFGAVFIIIPEPIVGGMFCIMFGMIAAFGLSALQYVQLNSSRNLYIIGFSMFFSLVLPKWLIAHPNAIQTGNEILDSVLTVICSTSILVGGLIGCFLDNTIPGTSEERGLIAWGNEMNLTNEPTTGEETSTYDFPVGMNTLRKMKWTYSVPFLPTYRPKKN
ncbi:hypothetical protein QTP88_019181 [Uroleucon formosanum]